MSTWKHAGKMHPLGHMVHASVEQSGMVQADNAHGDAP